MMPGKRFRHLFAALPLLGAMVVAAPHSAQAGLALSFGPPEDLGVPIQEVAVLDSAYGKENGRDVMYVTVSGEPAIFNVIDLASYKLLRSIRLEGTPSAWAHVVTGDGTVYIGGSKGVLHRYSPATGQVESLGRPLPSESFIWALTADEEGNVYGGTYPGGRVFKYDPRSGKVTDYGAAVPGQQYVRSIAYYNGRVYAGVGTEAALVEIDVRTGEKRQIPPPQGFSFGKFVYGLDVRRHYLFVFNSEPPTLLVYDLAKGTWLSERYPGYKGLFVSPEHNGKVYFVQNGQLMAFDMEKERAESTGISFGSYLRHAGWVELPGDRLFPGKSLVTVGYNGSVIVLNVQSGLAKTLPSIVEGQPVSIQALEKGPDGKLYLSGYMGTQGAQYDPATGKVVNFSLGQAEGMGALGTRMYFGVYPGAKIVELDTSVGVYPREVIAIEDEQDRPFAFESGDGKLFIGTIPTYGKLGGALTIYDPATRKRTTIRNIVPDQSIIGLAYRNGKLYGSTSVWGGLGVQPVAQEAKIFVLDVETGQKLAEVTPRIPGLDVPPKAIGDLTFGPDGKLWGAAQGTIFVMDPETLTVERARAIHPSYWNISHYWRPVYLRWGPDGLLYTTLGYKLTVIDPETLESRTLADSISLMTIGDDGHLYYAQGAHLYRIKVYRNAPAAAAGPGR